MLNWVVVLLAPGGACQRKFVLGKRRAVKGLCLVALLWIRPCVRPDLGMTVLRREGVRTDLAELSSCFSSEAGLLEGGGPGNAA